MKVKLLDSNLNHETIASIARLSRGKDPSRFDSSIAAEQTLTNCCNSNHMSVFEFGDVTYYIECPIYVARQLMRYRHASYLERSLRYNRPSAWEDDEWYNKCIEEYKRRLEAGEKQETARACLPLGTRTAFVMKVNLRSLCHIFEERLSIAAQPETRNVVYNMWLLLNANDPFFGKLFADKIKHPELYQLGE